MNTCPSCGAENREDARFCASCGASLVPACSQCGAELPETARFCQSCGARAPERGPAPAGQERRLVTVLFADVTGSTGLGERLDPERLQEVMGSYFSAMREEIEAEGGTVEKFIGDAVMAAFGVPAAHEDDPPRALRAALRMLRRLDEVNAGLRPSHSVTLQIRIGVNTGEVLAATAAKPGEAMVTGDAVNVAARLQQAAEPGQIVTSERTARAARGFRYRDLGPLELKGKAEPVAALVLLEERPGPERGVPGLRAPMIGRDREVALLQTIYERAASEGRPDLVTIYGDAGVGKSRLTSEFLALTERSHPQPVVVRGRCLPYGEGVTYWPMAEILKGHAGVLDTDPPDVALDKIRSAGAELLTVEMAPDPARATAALAFTVGVEDPAFVFRELEPRQVRSETHAAWRSFFSALASRGPVIAVIEDLHWADPALLDLLEELAERAQGGVLFVCSARPELTGRRPDWGGGRRNFSSISLDPLAPEEADRLVSLLLSVEELPETVHRRILERAEGNPFFLEEIVRHLIDEGRIVRAGDRWQATSDIGDVVIPDTVQAVLAARIDLLAPAEKRTLQSAAVVGRVFWPGPVGRLLNGERGELDDVLGRLEDRELVLERLGSALAGEREFMFKHILTRDVAYESLPRRDRGRAHAAVAEWIEATAGERRGEFAELLAYHYEEAHRGEREGARGDAGLTEELREKAFRALLLASEDARRRFAVQKAAALAERALSLAEDPVRRAVALEQVGMIALNDYRGDLAWVSFREAADLRERHAPDDRLAIARVCARAVEAPTRWPGSMSEPPGEEEVRPYVELGFANVGDADGEEHVRLLTARAFGPFAFATRREVSAEEFDAARADGERAAEMALRLGRPELASAALDGASSANITQGLYGPDVPLLERRLELARELEDPWELGDIYAMGSWGWALIGDYPRALDLGDEYAFRTPPDAEGFRLHCLSWVAFAEFHMGNWDRIVREVFPLVESILGDRKDRPPYFVANAFGAAAFVLDARREAAAASRLALIERQAAEGEAPSIGRMLRSWLAWIRGRQGRLEEARDRIEQVAAIPSDTPRPFVDQVRASILGDAGLWTEVPRFLADTRVYASKAGLMALPVHLDRLEGRAALAAGDPEAAIRLLAEASAGFERLQARWEKACTDLSLAEALVAAGRPEEAKARLEPAAAVFDELRSLREMERARKLATDLV
ncbi:MAG: ATP-binding protein [Actinomycetota bacterium]